MVLGLRLGEILGLKWEDLDFSGSTLRVQRTLQRFEGKLDFGSPKSESSRRTVDLPSFVKAILIRHQKGQEQERLGAGADWQDLDLVFTTSRGTPLHERNVRREFKKLLADNNLPSIRLHDLRHTCATLLLSLDVSPKVVSDTLGHSQIGITLDIYSHVLPTQRKLVADKLDSLFEKLDEDGVRNGVNDDSHSGRDSYNPPVSLGICGEPRRNRTFNPQIKRPLRKRK
jgi:integrase